MTTRKHVVLYTDDPDQGGVAVYNHALLCGLARAGYHVSCVQTECLNPRVEQQRALGVRHHWLGFHTRTDAVRSATNLDDPRAAFDALRPDMVVFANCSPFSHVAAKTVVTERGIPFVVVEGYVAPFGAVSPDVAWYLYLLEQHYRQARAVVAVSHENLDLLHRLYRLPAGKGEVIYYGRPDEYFAPPDPAGRERLRCEYGIPPDALLCLTVGRLEPVKGYAYQLEALKRLATREVWPRLRFAWIGPGPLHEEYLAVLRQLNVAEQVHILGQRWDVPAWLDASDAFLLPSLYEGMPLVVMEAMAKGVPVLASAVSGIPEELGDTGKLLPSPHDDPAGLVAEIVTTLEAWALDAERRRQVGAAGRARAERLFREDRMVHRTIQVIERALLPRGDYVAPGLDIVRPDPCFPHLTVADPEQGTWEYLRRDVPHNWYVDGRASHTGFTNRDEAHILYNTARRFSGARALEIGCWLGWSVCHLALGGLTVDVIDPVLGRADFVESIRQSLAAAGVLERVNLLAGFSPGAVRTLAAQLGRRWPFFFIDGNHEAPQPIFDAAVCAEFAEDDALILFHDLASPHVAHGLEYLRQCGWNTLVYMTAQIMGVAWRGRAEPIAHVPDPEIAWHVPDHLRRFTVAGMPDATRRRRAA